MAATPAQTAALATLKTAQESYRQAQVEISAAIDQNKQNITDAQGAVLSATQQLAALDTNDADPDVRANLVENIAYNESVIAANTNALNTNEARLTETQDLINQNTQEQESIAAAIDGPGSTSPSVPAYDPEAETAALLEQQNFINNAQLTQSAAAVDLASDPNTNLGTEGQTADAVNNAADEVAAQQAAGAAVGKNLAQQQAAKRAAENVPSQADWRVRLSLAQGSNYLYNLDDQSGGPGILKPLFGTNGVIFPYTPTIETSYHAKYNAYDLVHSNYRGYFYQNSYVDTVNIKGTFTAQDTQEAQYLLAVIHFFRSVTKMFYGATDQYAGTPPPLVFLNGLGQFQFNNHPCLVTNFSYSLPNDVDYIRADGFNNYNINLENRRTLSSGAAPGGILAGSFSLASKLGINKLFAGGIQTPKIQPNVNQQVNKSKAQNSTYVPTKMEISVQLLPTQTRRQVSQEFSVKKFASGDLLKKGFW